MLLKLLKVSLLYIAATKNYLYQIHLSEKSVYSFTAIGNAVAILIDAEKRKQYDMYGPEEERMQSAQHRQGHTHYNYTRGFEGKEKRDIN